MVFDKLTEHFVVDGDGVSAEAEAFFDLFGGAERSGDELRRKLVSLEQLEHRLEDFNAVHVVVADAGEVRSNVGGTGTGGEEGLVGVEDGGGHDGDLFLGEGVDGGEARSGDGDFDDEAGGKLVEGAGLGEHFRGGAAGDLGGDGAGLCGEELLEELVEGEVGFSDEGGIGGDAVDDAEGGGGFDGVEVGCV